MTARNRADINRKRKTRPTRRFFAVYREFTAAKKGNFPKNSRIFAYMTELAKDMKFCKTARLVRGSEEKQKEYAPKRLLRFRARII
ncbi:MAG: hypothetical protein DBX59_12155 [Bacillota bacterium]|nr:MAG: hypothetical protein DBX59_12155 [Bacillota bacterium]